MCWCRQRNCSVYFPPKLSIPCIFTTFQIYSQMYCIFVINYYILLLNTHIFTSHCILYVAMCSGMACMWLRFTEHQCTVCAKWTLSRTEDRWVWGKSTKWILSATPGQSPGTDVHGFHISSCLSSWYLSIYVYVSVYCVAPSSGAHTPSCQKKKQENEIKCMYPACLPSLALWVWHAAKAIFSLGKWQEKKYCIRL